MAGIQVRSLDLDRDAGGIVSIGGAVFRHVVPRPGFGMTVGHSDVGASVVAQTAVAFGDAGSGGRPDVPSAAFVSPRAHDGVNDQRRSGRLPDIFGNDIFVGQVRDGKRERSEFLLAGIRKPPCGTRGTVDPVGVVIIVHGVVAGIGVNGG